MNTRIATGLAAIALWALAPPPAAAQIPGLAPPGKSSAKAPALSTDTAARGLAIDTATLVRPVPPSEVPSVADHALVSAMDLLTSTAPRADLRKALAGIPLLLDSLALEEPVASLSARGLLTRRGLTGLGLEWSARDQEVREWRRVLTMAATHTDSARRELQRSLAEWRLTLAEPDTTLYPPAVRQRAENVLGRLVEVDSLLALRSAAILQADLGISDASARIFNELQAVTAARSEARRNLLRAESPPLWKGLSTGGAMGTARSARPAALQELAWFLAGNRGVILVHALLILLAMLVALRYRTDLKRTAEFEVPTGPYYATLGRPAASVALLGIAIATLLYPLAPLALYDLALLSATLPLFLLIPSLVPRDLVATARVAVGFFVAQRCLAIALMGSPAYRLVVLGVSLLGFGLLSLGLRSGSPLRQREPAWRHAIQVVAWVLFACCALAAVANVLGNVTLADAMNSAIAGTVDLAILLWGVTRVIEVLLSQAVRRGGAYSRDFRPAATSCSARWIGWWRWEPPSYGSACRCRPSICGDRCKTGSPVIWARPFASARCRFRSAIVLLFVVVLALGVSIARLFSGVVEFEVLDASTSAAACSVTVGSAAPLRADRRRLPDGAGRHRGRRGPPRHPGRRARRRHRVRPAEHREQLRLGAPPRVRAPDGRRRPVQVGTNTGEVREIGFRASVIRTFEGAEVIVPNASLISQDVINWTLSGPAAAHHRPVGVAYGSDPARVKACSSTCRGNSPPSSEPRAVRPLHRVRRQRAQLRVRFWTTDADRIVVLKAT